MVNKHDKEDKEESASSLSNQPRGISALVGGQFWERFSYYGMRAILLYYMYYAVTKGGLGFPQTTALAIMAIYGSLVYLASVPGAFVSDRILGARKSILSGGILIMIGHIFLALPLGIFGLFGSIAFLTLGTGLMKPSIIYTLGTLYDKDKSVTRREMGFTIFAFATNVGAFLAPLIVGLAPNTFSFHVGFGIAAIGMFFGLIYYYVAGKKSLGDNGMKPTDPLQPKETKPLIVKIAAGIIIFALIVGIMAAMHILSPDSFVTLLSIVGVVVPIIYLVYIIRSKKINKIERDRVLGYIPLFIGGTIFWALEEQGSSILALFAASQVNNKLGFLHIDPSWYQSLNPLFIMIYSPLFVLLWSYLGKRQPNTLHKFSYGLVFAGLSFLLMILPVMMFGVHSKVSPLWLVGSWAIMEIGEMLISPIGESITTRLAPKAFGAQMISVWQLSDATGQALNSQLAYLYTPGTEIYYFAGVGGVAIIASIVLLFFSKRVKRLFHGVEE